MSWVDPPNDVNASRPFGRGVLAITLAKSPGNEKDLTWWYFKLTRVVCKSVGCFWYRLAVLLGRNEDMIESVKRFS